MRITPAWAGKSDPEKRRTSGSGDHPRVGGEKTGCAMKVPPCQGSPPRGRGKVPLWMRQQQRPGITPAWAGKRCRHGVYPHRRGDHPRVGGEKERLAHCAAWAEGSPPRGRGKETSPHLYCELSRITPAWAGKSGSGSCYCLGSGDHPRMGGEKTQGAASHPRRRGSPPHGRGKAERKETAMMLSRITPAWAGKRPSQIRR